MLQGVLGMAVLSPAGIVSTVVTTDFRRGGGGVGRSATAIGHALEQLGGWATRLFLHIQIKKSNAMLLKPLSDAVFR
jgi:hypothetical protein